MIKITRDAQLEIDSDMSKSMMEKIATSVKDRRIGGASAIRFTIKEISKDTLKFFITKMNIHETDSIIPGERYHNRRDYMSFSEFGKIRFVIQNQRATACL